MRGDSKIGSKLQAALRLFSIAKLKHVNMQKKIKNKK
jgi:hypothetical protein